MLSRKQKVGYLAAGAGMTAAVLWLGYSKSGAGARSFLARTGAKAGKTFGSVRRGASAIQQRLEETDRLIHDFVQLGSRQKDRVETVLNDTWERFERTRELVLKNVELSSGEISALLGDLRTSFKQLSAAKSIRAA